ncbi:MAG TPA: HAD-IIA family hydrolase [Pseudonocardiaceae bacterium]
MGGDGVALLSGYDGVLLDLDGTVYRGSEAVPGAVASVAAARAAGVSVAYVTNNASRGPAEVAAQLVELGFDAGAECVVTSAQAGAALLAERVPAGTDVLVVGTEALADEVRGVGLKPVRSAAAQPGAVVQGHSPDTGWPILAEACLAIRAGAVWVACNVDPTLPTERGQLPGNGSMVAALRAATSAEPLVAGKPGRRLLDQAAERLGLGRPLVVGDRLDTDIAGAAAAGMDALFVLTGASTPRDLLATPAGVRPRFVAADLAALHEPEQFSLVGPHPAWTVELSRDTAVLHHRGDAEPDPVAALRALCAALWVVSPMAERGRELRGADAPSTAALAALGLS